eukprot:scaffold24550_cov60-Cyclotella_meneghiniana.AAC.14
MVALQLPVAIDFQFERTRFPSQIRNNRQRVPLIPSDCQVIGALLSTEKPSVSLAHQIEQSSVPQRIHSVMIFKITPPSKESTSMIQSTEFNGLSETLVLISSGSFSRFIGAVSKHLIPINILVGHRPSMSDYLPHSSQTSSPSQHDSNAEIDSLMPEGQHHRVNCRFKPTLFRLLVQISSDFLDHRCPTHK